MSTTDTFDIYTGPPDLSQPPSYPVALQSQVSYGVKTQSDANVLSKVPSKLGDKERTDNPSTIVSNPFFAVHWTCLSLVALWKIVDANRLQEPAKFALDGFARLQTGYGSPDTMALMAIAQRIDDYLTRAWVPVVDLHLAFEPWSLSKTKITHRLTQRLPGVFFNRLKSSGPIPLSEAFNFLTVGTTPVPPQLIIPGQQIQSLCTLGRRLRDIIEEKNTEGHEETLKSLESLHKIPVSLRGLNYLMKRQLWRLLDLCDGRGLGFTIELFFLALRQLHFLSKSSSPELTKVFYTGTFNIITSNWRKSKNSYIVEMLMDLVKKMVEGHGGSHLHINEVIEELEDDDLRSRMNHSLRDQALVAIGPPSHTAPP